MAEPTYHAEAEGLLKAYRQALAQCENLGLSTDDGKGYTLGLGEMQEVLRDHCAAYGIDRDYVWADHEPDQWPYTPPLDVWIALEERDPHLFWKTPTGHHQNLLDSAVEQIKELRAQLEARGPETKL